MFTILEHSVGFGQQSWEGPHCILWIRRSQFLHPMQPLSLIFRCGSNYFAITACPPVCLFCLLPLSVHFLGWEHPGFFVFPSEDSPFLFRPQSFRSQARFILQDWHSSRTQSSSLFSLLCSTSQRYGQEEWKRFKDSSRLRQAQLQHALMQRVHENYPNSSVMQSFSTALQWLNSWG